MKDFGKIAHRLVTLFVLLTVSFGQASAAYELPSSKDPKLNKDDLSQLRHISKGIAAISKFAQKGIVFVSISKVVKGQPFGTINPFDFFFGPQGDPFGQGGPGGPGQDPRQQRRPQSKAPEYKQEGLGSGFIVDLDKGYIITNNHVIDEADTINLKLANGESYEAKVVGRDKSTDVAVVQIKGKFNREGLEELSLGDSSDAEVGEICIALGAPFGLEASISMGVLSAIGRGSLSITDLGNFIQTDAAINPGNSGGPLVNTDGKVVGMNTAIFSRSGAYNGIGFAIPSNLVRQVAKQLINEGKVARGYIGVMLAPMEADLAKELNIPKEYKGALVRSVEEKGPAAKAGLEAGDVIVKVRDKKIDGVEHLRNEIGLHNPGSDVEIAYIRDGKLKTTKVKLGNYSDAQAAQQQPTSKDQTDSAYGLSIMPFNQTLKKTYKIKGEKGIVISGVQKGGAGELAGLEEGDLIVKVNNIEITSVKQFIQATEGKKRVLLRIERQGQYMIVPLER